MLIPFHYLAPFYYKGWKSEVLILPVSFAARSGYLAVLANEIYMGISECEIFLRAKHCFLNKMDELYWSDILPPFYVSWMWL